MSIVFSFPFCGLASSDQAGEFAQVGTGRCAQGRLAVGCWAWVKTPKGWVPLAGWRSGEA